MVAQEVKTLAGQTAKATDEIAAHIVNMQRATGESVDAIKAIGLTIERISEITTAISSAVEEQGTATQSSRQDRGCCRRHPRCRREHRARRARRQRDGDDLRSDAGSAHALSEVSIHLRDEVEKFLDSVRAA